MWGMGTSDRIPADSQFLSQSPAEDTLVDRGVVDPLDEGFSAPERWSAGERFGTTLNEMLRGESLDQRLAQEIPDGGVDIEDDDYSPDEHEVGQVRAGRLVDPHGMFDDEPMMFGGEVGIDGGAASAEEAAVHVIDDDWDYDDN